MRWSELLIGLWAASLSAAVIISAVLPLRALLRDRTPRRVFCILWDAALIRLLIFASLPSPVSVWRWLPKFSAVSVPALGTSFSPEIPAAPFPHSGEIVREGTAALPDAAALPAAFLNTETIFILLWFMVGLTLAVRFFWSHLRARRRYADSLSCADPFVCDWLSAHRLLRRMQVRTSDRIAAPLTYGVLRPVVLLPSGVDWTNKAALSCILEHEYQHIRRFDTLRKAILAAALCLHWFNPLVWVLYVLSNRDMELACDEAVTATGIDRAEYAHTLLSMEEQRGRLGLSGSHFSQNALEERIKSIMKHKHISVAAVIAVIAVMSISVAAFASAAPNDETPPQSDDNAPKTGFVYDHYQAVEGDVMILSKGGEDGEKLYSTDGGKSWLSKEEYRAQYGGSDWQVEWWTAEDYAVWLEEEKAMLQSIIGERGYTSGEGWFTWDQKRVDETIALYEGILEDIKNGMLYSKTIMDESGSVLEDVMLSGTVPEDTTGSVCEEDEVVDPTGQDVGALLKKYEPFGVGYEIYNVPGASGSLRMNWNGTPVHSLYDTETGTWFANNLNGTELGEDAIDLETVYCDGKLCGLQKVEPSQDTIHGAVLPVSDGNQPGLRTE